MVPKGQRRTSEYDDDMDESGAGESGDTDEIASDPFFQRYNFPHDEETEEDLRDSSSDTEGPMSPTQTKTRMSNVGGEALPSPVPRSPLPVRYVLAPCFGSENLPLDKYD